MNMQDKHRRTKVVRTGIGTDTAYGAVMPPLYLSSTFKREELDHKPPYEYSRTSNPTRNTLAEALAALEEGPNANVTASGMAALTLILHLLNPDDILLAPYDCYGRSYRLMAELAQKGHFKLKFVDMYSAEGLDEAFAEAPRMVLIESPSNPVLRIADIAAIAARAKAVDALTVVDNTFLSPMLQQPLKLGADIVYHSTTKFLNGHSDVVGGAVIPATQELWTELDFWNNSLGTIASPFDSYMTLRGMRTLELRIHRAEENTREIATFLDQHEAVQRVYYPGLSTHPGHEIATRQQEGFGAMLSFELKEGTDIAKFVQNLEIFTLAQSLGGTESLINHPAGMTHVSMGAEARAEAGVTDTLLRLSVGVEHIDDLIDDLKTSLSAI